MACGGPIRKAIALALLLLAPGVLAPASAQTDAAKAGLTVDVSGGYARLVFSIGDDAEASVRESGNVLIVSFSKPIAVSVDRLVAQASDYVGAARRDPDGKAVRLALAHKVTVNSLTAAGKFFLDLLPETWNGPPPGLPKDVIEELTRRAREAERLERLEHLAAQQRKPAQVRVRVGRQPTFTRYVFDLPEQTSVSADRVNDRLTLTFDAPIAFDLADADAALPATVGAINAEVEENSSLVRFSFLAKVDVRTFRDDKSYVVDVLDAETNPAERAHAAGRPLPNVALESGSPDSMPLEGARPGPAAPAPAEKPGAPGPPPTIIAAQPAGEPRSPLEMAAPGAPGAKPAIAAVHSQPQTQRSQTQPTPAQSAPTEPTLAATPAEKPIGSPAGASKSEAAATTAPPNPAPAAPTSPAGTASPTTPVSAAPAPPAAPERGGAPPRTTAREDKAGDAVAVDLSRQGATLKLSFSFMTTTAAAVFQRADTLWIVFDAKAPIDLSALEGESSRTIRGATFTRAPDADIVRIRLDHPRLISVATDGPVWTVKIGDSVFDSTRALEIVRNMIGPNHANVTIPFEGPHHLHRIDDPEVGDQIFVVTALAPARGFVNPQEFVEFRALASAHGVVIVPIADDLNVELSTDKIVVSRPNGLALSTALHSILHSSGLRPTTFDSQLWGLDRQSTYDERESMLMAAAAGAPAGKRMTPRLDLARFYIAREMYAEAKGVLDIALTEEHSPAQDVAPTVLRAITEVMMSRPEDALKDLSNPLVGDQHDAPLWRALAYARQGKWAQAREEFKAVEASIATLPMELQRVALKDEMRSAIEVGDFAAAANELNDFETIGVPREMQPAMSLLIGRLSEGLGHSDDALSAYQTAADSWDRPAAAQGRLRVALLRYARGEISRDDATAELETLTTIWRGDETEVEALKVLAHLYTEAGRYRDSFYVMRNAMAAHPNSDMTRRIQEEAAATFETLFLAGKGDAMPAIDALALFYDFRELTPIGRRGDEMIRRLADRLVSVDLLDQAADLLQYQVDHRLQGAARAQVATRLAVIYLMNRKADRALATLRATRSGDLASELRNQRLLLEARALSDLGRYDVALEVTAHIEGREAIRLRSDILWAARRWREAGEQIELYYGDRWKQWQPLNEAERSDILRAEICFALADDTLGLDRFREKYAAKMAQTPDARAFEIVSAPLGTSGAEFREVAHAAASVDTLEGFLRDMQARFPDASALPPPASPTAPAAAAPAAAAPAAAAPAKSEAPAAAPAKSRAPVAATKPQARLTRAPPSPPRTSARTAQR